MISREVALPTAQNSVGELLQSEARTHNFDWSTQQILVALSGGLDSVSLIRELSALRDFLGYSLEAVHFDHGLRGSESDLDAEFCGELCRQLRVNFHLIRLNFSKADSNLQARARNARKTFYKSWLSDRLQAWVATAHHRDDCIESFLIGVHQGRLDERLLPLPVIDFQSRMLRPLIRYSKRELTLLAVNNGWSWREDSSNTASDYLRNFYRNQWLVDAKFASSINTIIDDFEHLDNELQIWLDEQLNQFSKRGAWLPRNVCTNWEEGRFRDFWLAVLRRDYANFRYAFDVKRLLQVRSSAFKGRRQFAISRNMAKESEKLLLIELKRGYHLTVSKSI